MESDLTARSCTRLQGYRTIHWRRSLAVLRRESRRARHGIVQRFIVTSGDMEFEITAQPVGGNVPPDSWVQVEILGLPTPLSFTFSNSEVSLPPFDLATDGVLNLDLRASFPGVLCQSGILSDSRLLRRAKRGWPMPP
jgi:hypothetical protein